MDAGAAATGPTSVPPGGPSELAFALDILHEIALEVEPALLPQLLTDRTKRIPVTLTFDGATIPDVVAHRKGLTTGSSSKPSLVLDINELGKGRKLFGLQKIVLNNAIQDPSFLNVHLAYEFFRMAGLPAPRTARRGEHQRQGLRPLHRRGGDGQGVPRARVRQGQQ
jgi:hypothetical protein